MQTSIEQKNEREIIRFEQAKKRIRKNLARATIRKHLTNYMLIQREKRERFEYFKVFHIDEVLLIQAKYRAYKTRPMKLNVRKFKDTFYAVLQGWRVRRIISYIKTLPEIREAIDYIHLRLDIKEVNLNDPFQKQIITQFPMKIKIVIDKYHDLNENAVWIKKPVTTQSKPKKVQPKSQKNVKKPKVCKKETKSKQIFAKPATKTTKPVIESKVETFRRKSVQQTIKPIQQSTTA